MSIFLGMTPKQIRTAYINTQMGSFSIALAVHDQLNEVLDFANRALAKYPKGDMGLTPDIIKRMPQWQADKRAFEASMRNLREFNTVMLRKYKREYRQHVKERRAAKLQSA